jgi:hypothetical protein
MRISHFASEYFPLREHLHEENLFLQLRSYLVNKNYPLLAECFRSNAPELHYRATPWFSGLLLTLQSDRLLPADFETVRLLLLKMQVGRSWNEEFECLGLLGDILNKAKLTEGVL